MPSFSLNSWNKLKTCDQQLQDLFNEVVKTWDCTIVCGHRGKIDQDEAFSKGRSKLKFPESNHNTYPSLAVDVAPYNKTKPHINWNDLGGFYMFAGYVLHVAEKMGIKVRYGGDWDGDRSTADQRFHDLPHWEVVE